MGTSAPHTLLRFLIVPLLAPHACCNPDNRVCLFYGLSSLLVPNIDDQESGNLVTYSSFRVAVYVGDAERSVPRAPTVTASELTKFTPPFIL